ncbi:transcription elongation factor SPT4-like protein [Paraphysoderma sedebokerense]|nr:transcription elongation factor SPT4-like protein [Paraphysoderma sedebokerense]
MASEVPHIPQDKKQLRACMLCGLVKNAVQFRRQGCENCEEILQLRGSQEKVMECTTSNFDGLVSLMNPNASWVAKWQRVDKFVQGIYAIRVAGRVPEYVEEELQSRGITYRPRDGSAGGIDTMG